MVFDTNALVYAEAMKATLEIDALLMQRLLYEAERRGATASALAEAGIRSLLSEDTPAVNDCPELPDLPVWRGGEMLVDISNREELYRVMDEYDGFRY